MPNQRAAGIVNVSFTMPLRMARALESRARAELTNKSEIVRRAIMAYLPADEVAAIMSSVLNNAPSEIKSKKASLASVPGEGGKRGSKTAS